MTARDGFSRDMDPFALDAGTADRLVNGAVDVADAPPEYRAVARIFQSLRQAPDAAELLGEPAAVEAISAAVMLERRAGRARPSRRVPARVGRLAVMSAAALSLGLTGGLASAGALPAPAQNVASDVLGTVGISVPTSDEAPADQPPPATSSSPAPPASAGSVQPNPIGGGQNGPAAPAPARPAPRDNRSEHPPNGQRDAEKGSNGGYGYDQGGDEHKDKGKGGEDGHGEHERERERE